MSKPIFTEQQTDFMESIFAMCEAVGDEVSIQDMADVMAVAVEGGWDRMRIIIAMATNAIDLAEKAALKAKATFQQR